MNMLDWLRDVGMRCNSTSFQSLDAVASTICFLPMALSKNRKMISMDLAYANLFQGHIFVSNCWMTFEDCYQHLWSPFGPALRLGAV